MAYEGVQLRRFSHPGDCTIFVVLPIHMFFQACW